MSKFVRFEFDPRSLLNYQGSIASLSREARKVMRFALNQVGDLATTRVKRTLVDQTGVKYGAVGEAVRLSKASDGNLTYTITGTGKHYGLKDFGARQGKRGVSAAPWKQRRVFKSTFLVPSLSGHVFKRTSNKRLPIEKLWGPSIPKEMLRDRVPKEFNAVVGTQLEPRVRAKLAQFLPR